MADSAALAEEQEDSGAERDGNRAEEPGLALVILAHPVSRLVGRETHPHDDGWEVVNTR